MLYQIHNGTVMFGADTILKDINFEIKNSRIITECDIIIENNDYDNR